MLISIKVIPKAHKSEIAGWEGEELKIRLKAAPEKGEANVELIAFLSKAFSIPKSNITLISGATSRHKRVEIHGLTEDGLKNKLNLL